MSLSEQSSLRIFASTFTESSCLGYGGSCPADCHSNEVHHYYVSGCFMHILHIVLYRAICIRPILNMRLSKLLWSVEQGSDITRVVLRIQYLDLSPKVLTITSCPHLHLWVTIQSGSQEN